MKIRKMKSALKTLLHVLLYFVVLILLFILITGIGDSFRGYRLQKISGSYINGERILTFSVEGRVSVETGSTFREYSYFISEGTVYFSDEAYWIYANGLLDREENRYYVKI